MTDICVTFENMAPGAVDLKSPVRGPEDDFSAARMTHARRPEECPAF